MWLVAHARWDNLAPLAVGHYGFLQLVVVWWALPLLGSVLVAAKVISAVATVFCVACVGSLAARDGSGWAAVTAMVMFVFSSSVLLTGQSEFGDPMATAFYLAGLWLWFTRPHVLPALAAGVLLGMSGLVRTHFVAFSVLTAVLCAVVAAWRQPPLRSAAVMFLAGTLLGNAPGMWLNLHVHGQLGSPVAPYFVGMVLNGYDEYDLANTYAKHPLSDVIRNQPWELLRHLLLNSVEHVGWWAPALLGLGLTLRDRQHWTRARVDQQVLLALLALVFFAMLVAPAWWVSPRLVFPLRALLCVLLPVALFRSLGRHPRWRPWLAWGGPALLLFLQAGGVGRAVGRQVAASHSWWEHSTRLVEVLRQHGMTDAGQALVVDWNRFVVDDPALQPFYNFGFWNLLLPEYAAARPNPAGALQDLETFGGFLTQHNIRFVVLSKGSRRFPPLTQVLEGQATLQGYTRILETDQDVILMRTPTP